jgi:mannan endo-1,4-beta-mannosidase
VTQRRLERTARWGSHRRSTRFSEHAGVVTCAAVVIAAALLVAGVKLTRSPAPPPDPPAPKPTVQQIRYFGVYEPNAPQTYAGVNKFARAVGRQPNLVSYYSGWGETFQRRFAETAARHGAKTIVQMDPTNISLTQIADGAYDASYLRPFAKSVAAFGQPVVISFGHEMNGFWYTWGYHHSSPASFIAAWRHIVNLFNHEHANNVTWLWQVNSDSKATGPVRRWWPGAKYVNWIGVSGYYWRVSDTFSFIFEPVVADVRRFSQDPVLIAETGVGPFPGRSHGIINLFTGLRSQHYLGLVWFNRDSHGGLFKGEDWRLRNKSAALATFRAALSGTDAHP